ncbi:hypothetical protein GOV11_02700 [Candidatus Woesearchaeota archaeon]|nr:hypothetical protein [Candidatus Woesearchaeota archaeon]
MKLLIPTMLMMIVLTTSVFAGSVGDGTGPWADAVVNYSQGLRDDGSSVTADRSNPNQALGPAEGTDSINFFALGYGGWMELFFENGVADGDGIDLVVRETTYNNQVCENYPERVSVEVSSDGADWIDVGTGCQDFNLELSDFDLECIQFVRLTDITDSNDFNVNHITDAYDVDGVEAIYPSEPCDTCEETVYPLFAGQDIDVGTLTVDEDGDNLVITYSTTGDWVMTETHLDVQCSTEEIPRTVKRGKKNAPDTYGGPIPGHFKYVAYHDPAVTEWTETLERPDCDGNLIIAAHAVVRKEVVLGTPHTTVVSDTSVQVTDGNIYTNLSLYPYNAIAAWQHSAWISNVNPTFAGSGATWIWESVYANDPLADEYVTFKKTFEIEGEPTAGTLRITCDNEYTATLNGLPVGVDDNWKSVESYDVTSLLNAGSNTLEVIALNWGTPGSSTGSNPGACIFDLEADSIVREVYEETAWSNGTRFVPKGNWATYSEYAVCE